MCYGTAGAVVCEGWDEAVEVVIMNCLDGGTMVTLAGVVLLVWELAARSETIH